MKTTQAFTAFLFALAVSTAAQAQFITPGDSHAKGGNDNDRPPRYQEPGSGGNNHDNGGGTNHDSGSSQPPRYEPPVNHDNDNHGGGGGYQPPRNDPPRHDNDNNHGGGGFGGNHGGGFGNHDNDNDHHNNHGGGFGGGHNDGGNYYPPTPHQDPTPYYPPADPTPYYPPAADPTPYYPPSEPDPAPYYPPSSGDDGSSDDQGPETQTIYIQRAVADERITLEELADYAGWKLVSLTANTTPNSKATTLVRLAVDEKVVASQKNPGRKINLAPRNLIISEDSIPELWITGSTYIDVIKVVVKLP